MDTQTTNSSNESAEQVVNCDDADLDEPLPTRTCNVGDGECESCQ